MKRRPSVRVLEKRRLNWQKKLAELGPCMRGSLCTAKRGNHVAHQLTVSVKGKTHTVYVPLDMVEEVNEWIKNYRRAQRIMEEISKLSMAIIHCHVPERRGDARRRENRSPNR